MALFFLDDDEGTYIFWCISIVVASFLSEV